MVLALVAAGGVGYLWYAGKLPGRPRRAASPAPTTAAGAQKRDVIVVHLHNTKGGGTSTALLVDNTTTKQGTTVLLPNSLALTDDDGTTTTLAKSVDDDGSSGTRDAIDTVLGTDIEGTWRLDTPYLNNLVELVGNIDIDTNADVPDPDAKKKGEAPLVKKGEEQTLSGKMAVAYATYRASGESQTRAAGAVRPGHAGRAAQAVRPTRRPRPTTVQTLAQILDPSLTDKDLGAFLAKLADHAKGGDYKTALLPVQQDGTLSEQATDSVVKDVLGGTVKSPEQGRRRPRRHQERHRRRRTPPRRPGSSWSTAATPSWTPARPPPPRPCPRSRTPDAAAEGRRRRGRQDPGPARRAR